MFSSFSFVTIDTQAHISCTGVSQRNTISVQENAIRTGYSKYSCSFGRRAEALQVWDHNLGFAWGLHLCIKEVGQAYLALQAEIITATLLFSWAQILLPQLPIIDLLQILDSPR